MNHNQETDLPIPKIEVIDFVEMGRIVANWAHNPDARPATVAELRQQLDGVAVVPDRVKGVMFVQSSLETLVLRLPESEMMAEAEAHFANANGSENYETPNFYRDQYEPGSGAVLNHLDFLYARVGDYTIAQCR